MTQAALSLIQSGQKPYKESSSIDDIMATHSEELIIGICSYIGTNTQEVINSLINKLKRDFGYECEVIKISDYIKKYNESPIKVSGSKEFQRIKESIHGGNSLRQKSEQILAEYAIKHISIDRKKGNDEIDSKGNPIYKSRRKCFIIDSLKNLKEYDLFKNLYRNLFFLIGIYSSYDIREKNLKSLGLKTSEITELIEQDSNEEIDNGQKVEKLHTKADYYLRIDSELQKILDSKITRLLDLLFGAEIIVPTKEETAMYFAASAASNSACLSRQVGAAIVDSNCDLLAVGWNDVPCVGGNLYQGYNLENDKRCYNLMGENAGCLNDQYKKNISQKLYDSLIKNKIIKKGKEFKLNEIILDSDIKNLIEYSRAIHAEMHAIIIGSQKSGDKMIGGKIFCTTYPCHNCARHIVLAGITEVYFIEPYSKSLATTLHFDALTEDENVTNKVRLILFDGISPYRYMDYFKSNNITRKKNGKRNIVDKKKARPRYAESIEAIPTLESLAIKRFRATESE